MEKRELEKVLELQARAYELLMWVNAQAASQPELLSEESVQSLKYATSCRAWIEKRAGSFPVQLRVEPRDLEAFSHLLSAFFSTSFRVEEVQRGLRSGSGYNWEIEKRRRLVSGAMPARSKAAREKVEQSARNLQLIALEELAIENDVDLSRAQLEVLLGSPELSESIVLWSYGHELVRRSKFASQGASVHAMWRALDDKARAKLDVQEFWSAWQVLVEAMRAAS